MEQTEEKIFFKPGDVVELRLPLDNKPRMIVVRKETNFIPDAMKETLLKGIRCRWFSKDGILLEATWSTKDLQLIK